MPLKIHPVDDLYFLSSYFNRMCLSLYTLHCINRAVALTCYRIYELLPCGICTKSQHDVKSRIAFKTKGQLIQPLSKVSLITNFLQLSPFDCLKNFPNKPFITKILVPAGNGRNPIIKPLNPATSLHHRLINK